MLPTFSSDFELLLFFFQVFEPPREKFAKEKSFYVEIVIKCCISVYEDKIVCGRVLHEAVGADAGSRSSQPALCVVLALDVEK